MAVHTPVMDAMCVRQAKTNWGSFVTTLTGGVQFSFPVRSMCHAASEFDSTEKKQRWSDFISNRPHPSSVTFSHPFGALVFVHHFFLRISVPSTWDCDTKTEPTRSSTFFLSASFLSSSLTRLLFYTNEDGNQPFLAVSSTRYASTSGYIHPIQASFKTEKIN